MDKLGFQRKSFGLDPKVLLYDEMKSTFSSKNNEILSVVFSKDRAMQLDCFLASYFENVSNFSIIKVIYRASDERHMKSYNELKLIYSLYPIEFVEESDFRKDIINIINNSLAGRICFYVDDMIFTSRIDYSWFDNINPLEDIICLSRGKDLCYSTVLAKEISLPSFMKFSKNLFRFKWNELKEFSEWTYPLGVSGYIYSRLEILSIIKVISFKAPNSLENNMQIFLSYFKNRNGVCLENVITPCIHTNLTQTEGYNNILGYYSLEDLLVLWNQNKRIDFKEFMGLKSVEAELKKYTFIEREIR
jgi:hypothetical protein